MALGLEAVRLDEHDPARAQRVEIKTGARIVQRCITKYEHGIWWAALGEPAQLTRSLKERQRRVNCVGNVAGLHPVRWDLPVGQPGGLVTSYLPRLVILLAGGLDTEPDRQQTQSGAGNDAARLEPAYGAGRYRTE